MTKKQLKQLEAVTKAAMSLPTARKVLRAQLAAPVAATLVHSNIKKAVEIGLVTADEILRQVVL
jgi:hypothetical protein